VERAEKMLVVASQAQLQRNDLTSLETKELHLCDDV
jgi:hypothetical protein